MKDITLNEFKQFMEWTEIVDHFTLSDGTVLFDVKGYYKYMKLSELLEYYFR